MLGTRDWRLAIRRRLPGWKGIPLPEPGLCLDVACGLGRQSLWAAAHGFDVVAIDVSPAAIGALRASAAERGLDGRIDARVVDLDDGLPADVADRCALVICQRFRDPRLYPALADAAAPRWAGRGHRALTGGRRPRPARITRRQASSPTPFVRSTSRSSALSRRTGKRRSSPAGSARECEPDAAIVAALVLDLGDHDRA